jgi:hypothetical protein
MTATVTPTIMAITSTQEEPGGKRNGGVPPKPTGMFRIMIIIIREDLQFNFTLV